MNYTEEVAVEELERNARILEMVAIAFVKLIMRILR
jgi:hypothetical protein